MLLAPLATIAFWGSSYMLDCIRALEAPGIPIEFSFQSNAGELTVEAQSYVLAPQRGTLFISRPKLTDSAGNVIAQLESY